MALKFGKNKGKNQEDPPKITGFFPWQKNKEAQKAQRADALIGAVLKHLPGILEIWKKTGGDNGNTMAVTPPTEGNIVGKLYDFFVDYGGTIAQNNHFFTAPMGDPESIEGFIGANTQEGPLPKNDKSERISAKPKDVLNELETIPNPASIENIDEKIATLKDKSLMVNQRYAKTQIDAMVKRLENRKKFAEHEEFYRVFPNTNDEKIDHFLSRFKLVMKPDQLFIPTFPKEAIDVMKEYTRVTKLVCDEEPVFYVIAEESDFQQKFKKLDPILLAQSPFGFWWQILGAWDKEMLLLSEL